MLSLQLVVLLCFMCQAVTVLPPFPGVHSLLPELLQRVPHHRILLSLALSYQPYLLLNVRTHLCTNRTKNRRQWQEGHNILNMLVTTMAIPQAATTPHSLALLLNPNLD